MFNAERSRLQHELFGAESLRTRQSTAPFKKQLLKWVGNKQRFAHEIISFFPDRFLNYYEPFLGSGAVLGTLMPQGALGSDVFKPLMGIWQMLKTDPSKLVQWYEERIQLVEKIGKERAYQEILASYNSTQRPADFVFLSRACYGGVIRFRRDGYMSTPCGPHTPISVDSFTSRVKAWSSRIVCSDFATLDYREALFRARSGDLVYCDPPYSKTQAILYGAQDFSLKELLVAIGQCKDRGVSVVLSIDGSKKSGHFLCNVEIPSGLFEREVVVNVGRSMLRRFQKEGLSLEDEVVHDRLLMTY